MMTRILLGLIVLGAGTYVVMRVYSPAGPSGNNPVAVAESGESGVIDRSSAGGGGSSRFQQLMEKATGQSGAPIADADALREFVRRVDPSRLTFGELSELLESLGEDPETGLILMDRVLEDSEREWQPTEKISLFRRAGMLAAQVDEVGLEQRLDDLTDSEDRRLFVQGAADGLAQVSIEKSLMWIGGITDETLQLAALHGVGKAWGSQNRDDAMKWIDSLETDEEKAQALRGVIADWVSDDADAAIEFAHAASPEIADGLIVEAASTVALTSPKIASEWVVTAHEDPRQMEVLEETVAKWADEDFEGVAAWAALVHRSDLRDTAMVSLAGQWSATDPKKATEWAAEFPDKDARARMLQRTLSAWAQENPGGAAAWVTELPVDLNHINIVKSTIEALVKEDPDAARAWLDQVDSPAYRQIGGGVLDSF